MAPRRSPAPERVAPRLAGALLVLASAALAASAVPAVPAFVGVAGLALVAAAVCGFAEIALADRRFGAAATALIVLGVADRTAELAVAVDSTWAVAMAVGAHILWRSSTTSPARLLVLTAPSAAAVALTLATRGAPTDAAAMAGLTVAAGLLAALVALPRARAAAVRTRLARDEADVDALVMANLELRNADDADDAARRTARIATELLDADGAVVWLQGPGRLLCAGGYGTTPPPERGVVDGSTLEQALLTGAVARDADELVLPLTASGGVFGAVTVSSPRRGAPSFESSVLQVLGALAGSTLERLRAMESLIDARFVDPVTGVGNRMAATASLATMRAGDAVLLLAVDDLARIRAEGGDASADLVLGQLGLHLRTAIRAGDLIARLGDDVFFIMLRALNATAETVVGRLLESWHATGPPVELRGGAALHVAGSTPLDTLDRASEALDEACGDGRSPLAAAAERAAWGPDALSPAPRP